MGQVKCYSSIFSDCHLNHFYPTHVNFQISLFWIHSKMIRRCWIAMIDSWAAVETEPSSCMAWSYRCTYPLWFQMMSLKMAVLIGNHTSSLNNTQVWLHLICSFTTCQRRKSCSAKKKRKKKKHSYCWVKFHFAWLLQADKRTCPWIHGSHRACKSIPVKLFSCKNLKQHMGEK